MFPVWDGAADSDIFGGNIRYAKDAAGDIINTLYLLEDKIKAVGFYGCDKSIDDLIVLLIGLISLNIPHNRFEIDKLPFHGTDKAWYILATTEENFYTEIFIYRGINPGSPMLGMRYGINSTGSMFGFREYHFLQPFWKDTREDTKGQKLINKIYLCEAIDIEEEHLLAKLIEKGKVMPEGDRYIIKNPVLSAERGDIKALTEILAPVFEKTNAMQSKIYTRSCETVKKYIPKHLSDCTEFFGSFCAHDIPETALFGEIISRGVKITQDMVTWYTVK